FSETLERVLPQRWIKTIAKYSTNTEAIKSVSNWQIILRANFTQINIHSVVIVGVILLSSVYILPLVESSKFGNALAALITLVILAPFLWALSLRRVAVKEVEAVTKERKYRGPIAMLIILRILLTMVYLGFLLNTFFSAGIAIFALVAAVLAYIIFPKKLNRQYQRIENHFLKNLNARDLVAANRSRRDLTPWDGHMT